MAQPGPFPADQLEVCARFGVEPFPAPEDLKAGLAANVREGVLPINGLRHPPTADTCGWYLWAGEEFSEEPDFFQPVHVSHMREWCPEAVPYLALPPGWRFLIAPDYEGVWEDRSLLDL